MIAELIGVATVLAPLVLAIVERRAAGAPQRERTQQDKDYDRDVQHNAQAAATGDAATLTQHFEAERQAAIRRGDIEPAPPAGQGPEARGNGH